MIETSRNRAAVDAAYQRITDVVCGELWKLSLHDCARLLWLLIQDQRAALRAAVDEP